MVQAQAEKLDLTVGQEFENFGGTYAVIPAGAVFAYIEEGKYVYDPYFDHAESGEWVVRRVNGWTVIKVEVLNPRPTNGA